MKIEDIKSSKVRYRIDSAILNIKSLKKPYEIDTRFIASMFLNKDFDNYYLPFFTISVGLPNSVYREMKKNPNDNTIALDIKKGWYKKDEDGYIPPFKSYLKDTFYIFMEDSSPDTTEEMQKTIEATAKNGMNMGDLIFVDLLVYNKTYLFNLQTIVNNIITSAPLIDIVAFLCNKIKIKNVLVSPPSGYTAYKEFRLLPIPAINMLERICNTYALHKYGSLVFFDLNMGYIIEKDYACSAYATNEVKTTYLASAPKFTNGNTDISGCYHNTTEKYYAIALDSNNIQISNKDEKNTTLLGDDTITVNTGSGKVKTSSNKTTSSGKINIQKVVIQNDGSDTSSAQKSAIEEESKILTASMMYVDLDILNPNKRFVLTIDDNNQKKYNGNYRITQLSCMFTKEGEYFCPKITCEFKGK